MMIEPEPLPLVRDEAGRLIEVWSYLAEQERESAEIQAGGEVEHPRPEGLSAKLLARLES